MTNILSISFGDLTFRSRRLEMMIELQLQLQQLARPAAGIDAVGTSTPPLVAADTWNLVLHNLGYPWPSLPYQAPDWCWMFRA